jgi:single-strand DNA-binding protein
LKRDKNFTNLSNTLILKRNNKTDMIKLQVIGNLGKDAVLNNVNGKSVINFTVAHTERFKDAQGVQKDKTTWVDCAYWTDRTGIAPYLKKGTSVYVEGTPDVRTYTTADGRNGATLSLRTLNIQLLGGKPNEGGVSQPENNSGSSNTMVNSPSEPLDDLPF